MNINNFIAKVNNQDGPAQQGRYKVTIIPPSISGVAKNITNTIFNGLSGITVAALMNRYFAMFQVDPLNQPRMLELLAIKASLPSVNYITTERKIYGPENRVPYDTVYDMTSVEFICTSKMKEKYFFDAWINMIKDPLTNDFNFLSEYATTIIIRQYDVANKFQYGIRLIDAYPIGINSIDLTYAEKNAFLKLNVNFTFRKWENLKAYDSYINEFGEVLNGIDDVNSILSPSGTSAITF